MSLGQPIFTQDVSAEAPKPAVETQSRRPTAAERFAIKLRHSANWSEIPCVNGQAKLFPDTVKVVDERYMTFVAGNKADMDVYSEIRMSCSAGGKYKIVSEEAPHWDEKSGNCVIVMRVQERLFKVTRTSQSDPDEP